MIPPVTVDGNGAAPVTDEKEDDGGRVVEDEAAKIEGADDGANIGSTGFCSTL